MIEHITVEGFELYEEASGDRPVDRSSTLIGIISNELAAKQWVSQFTNFRMYVPVKRVTTIFSSVEEIEQSQKEAKIATAVKKLTDAELDLLKEYFRSF